MVASAARAMSMALRKSSRQPGSPRHHRAPPRKVSPNANGDPMTKLPFVGSPSARVMTRSDNRKTSASSPLWNFAQIAARVSPTVSVGSPMDSSSRVCSEASFDASGRWAVNCCATRPVMPIANERLSPASSHSSRSSSKPVSAPLPPTRNALAHNSVRGAIRIAIRSRASSGRRSATSRALRQLVCAATMSRLADHVPARMCQAYAAGRSPAASRCSAIRAAFSSAESGSCCSISVANRRCNAARSDLSCDS